MANLCAIFEEWYMDNENYPPLRFGQKVNLSFYILAANPILSEEGECYLNQIKLSEYSFCGKIIRQYQNNELIVVDTGALKFYIEPRHDSPVPKVGQFIAGSGQLMIDYSIWHENAHSYENPPNLFYSFIIDKIQKVSIPEKYIKRSERGYTAPASLVPSRYSDNDISEIKDMKDDYAAAAFYLLNLEPISEDVTRESMWH